LLNYSDIFAVYAAYKKVDYENRLFIGHFYTIN